MEAKVGKFFDSVTNFFSGSDQLPWCDADIIAGCEKEAAEANGSDESKNECLTRFSWALVHSRRTEDIERASIASTTDPLKMREKLYLLAVGHFRRGDYSRSRELVEQCLMVEPEWRQAQSLKKAIEDRITKDGVIGIGIAVSAAGLIAGGIAAALSRKK
ncbi:hypothetical protein ERO13_D13G221666v2 [Gossypium hirsutum]|uniref:Mitochondrial fission 1 protein n=3 Tax=Gossypium TaxID=3633 RepID=A0A1U8N5U8_GOSHI|nr:mitochondrial fission 1 protein A isoform X2 [Gossypium hirsutum]KAG4113402.1 hypothetical protein ERO13_D13G221666v2 [Gossypium hirsutum]TYH36515.1 hypothetical protein ES332_D13G270100v1 [Gossypium tomentosum]TYI48609.1 hypothetical protein E1A91_D13G260000v1 [Gossypium mustelinum]